MLPAYLEQFQIFILVVPLVKATCFERRRSFLDVVAIHIIDVFFVVALVADVVSTAVNSRDESGLCYRKSSGVCNLIGLIAVTVIIISIIINILLEKQHRKLSQSVGPNTHNTYEYFYFTLIIIFVSHSMAYNHHGQ